MLFSLDEGLKEYFNGEDVQSWIHLSKERRFRSRINVGFLLCASMFSGNSDSKLSCRKTEFVERRMYL